MLTLHDGFGQIGLLEHTTKSLLEPPLRRRNAHAVKISLVLLDGPAYDHTKCYYGGWHDAGRQDELRGKFWEYALSRGWEVVHAMYDDVGEYEYPEKDKAG